MPQSRMVPIHDKYGPATRVARLLGADDADTDGHKSIGCTNNCHASSQSQSRLALNVHTKYNATATNSTIEPAELRQFCKLDRLRNQRVKEEVISDKKRTKTKKKNQKQKQTASYCNNNNNSSTTTSDMAHRHHRHHFKLHLKLSSLPLSKALLRPLPVALPVLLSLSLLLVQQFALASPPVDYFMYTSQLMTAQAGAQNVTSMLPPIQEIYAPPPQSQNGSGGGGGAKQQFAVDQMAKRVMALVGNSSHEHDNNMADLEATRFAWSLMEKQALLYMRNRITSLRPFIAELLSDAQVSGPCNGAIQAWLDELGDLKQWATLMWNSWGQFPMAGVFQGSYTDLGSYHGCMRIADNELIGQAQYCMLDFQPIVPTRPRFHSIFKRILDHNPASQQLTNGDFDQLLASQAEPNKALFGSHASAHTIASSRYKDLYREPGRPEQSGAAKKSVVLASILAPSDNGEPGNHQNRYNKRTIVSTSGSAGANNNGTSSTQESAEEGATTLADASRKLNLTLKAEALIELALKAQYFYYVKFRIGACLPTKCSKEDVSQLARTGKFQLLANCWRQIVCVAAHSRCAPTRISR